MALARYTLPPMGRVWSEEQYFAQQTRVIAAAARAWMRHLGEWDEELDQRLRQLSVRPAAVREVERATDHETGALVQVIMAHLRPQDSRYVYRGLTSSDVLDTGLALQIRAACAVLLEAARALRAVLLEHAVQHRLTVQIGRTHGVHAEPVTWGKTVLGWADTLDFHLARLEETARQVAVGKLSGSVGTWAYVPPAIEEAACAELGLQPARVSTQIIDRSRHAAVVAELALFASSLSNWATEVRNLQRTEALEVEEPFEAGRQGSSSMPHKRNPARCERIVGLARLLQGFAATALQNSTLWHQRDISHSAPERVVIPDSFIYAHYMTDLFTRVMRGLVVYPQHMRRNLGLTRGLIHSQQVLDLLLGRGLGRTEAYALVQRLARRAWEEGQPFREVLAADPEARRWLTDADLERAFDLADPHLRHIRVAYERMGLSGLEWPAQPRA